MTPAEIIVAVQRVGATLRVEGESLVASNASRIAPGIKTAIRERKPELMSALMAPTFGPGCKVTIVQISATGLRYRRTFAHLQLRAPAYVPEDRWRQCIEDGRAFLAKWRSQAEALGWTSEDLFGLHPPPAHPHPSYRRLSRYDCTGLLWLLQGKEVIALAAHTAKIRNHLTGNVTIFRKNNRPAYGPLGDSLDDFV
jgi:hypothetical protein